MYQALYNECHVTKYSEKIDLPLGLFMHIQAQAVLLMDINLQNLIDGSSFLLKVWEYCSLYIRMLDLESLRPSKGINWCDEPNQETLLCQ